MTKYSNQSIFYYSHVLQVLVQALLTPVLHKTHHDGLGHTGGKLGTLALQQHVLADKVGWARHPADAHAGGDHLRYGVYSYDTPIHVQRKE